MQSESCLSCDTLNLDGTMKDPGTKRDTYSSAQKMHASMTYIFGRVHRLGTLQWQENETTGEMKGNPSVCETVSTYMVSLRRRKVLSYHSLMLTEVPTSMFQVQAGESATSARAITPVSVHCLISIRRLIKS